MTLLVPAEGEDHLLLRHHLEVFARRLVLTGDKYSMHAPRSWVDLGNCAVPEHVHVGLGQEWPDGLWRSVDHDLADEFSHHLLPFGCLLRDSAVSATSRSRSSPEVQ